MSIFGIIKSDEYVFAGDSIRIDASESRIVNDTIAAVNPFQVSVDGGLTFVPMNSSKYIDWIFPSDMVVDVIVKITTLTESKNFTKTITVLDPAQENLFSKDNDLYPYEPEIDRLLPKKWSSWNIVHLEAQKQILQWLDRKGIRKPNGTRYEASEISSISQVKEWSLNLALSMIHKGNSNQVDDIFSQKSDYYAKIANEKAELSYIELTPSDGVSGSTDLRVVRLVRG